MIKYKLVCKDCEITFDSWFASSQEYEKLKKKKFLNCHNCSSLNVEKSLMAPTLISTKNTSQSSVNELEKIRAFRPPWLYSLLWILRNSITTEELITTRIICDPSAAGKERGVHNCRPKDPSNDECLAILNSFVEHQDVMLIPEEFTGPCWEQYKFEILLGN